MVSIGKTVGNRRGLAQFATFLLVRLCQETFRRNLNLPTGLSHLITWAEYLFGTSPQF